MKKILLSLVLFLLGNLAWGLNLEIAGESIHLTGDFQLKDITELTITSSKYCQVMLTDSRQGGLPQKSDIGHYTELLALPETGNWQVTDINYAWDELQLEYPLVNNSLQDNNSESNANTWLPENIVTISKPVIMRQLRFSQLSVAGMQYNPGLNKIRIIKDLDMQLQLEQNRSVNNKQLSGAAAGSAFSKLAEDNISGYTASREQSNGSYLIICPDIPEVVGLMEYLANWKRKLGHETVIATLTETGSTNDQIFNYLQNAYDTWTNRPEYVILVGDVSGNIVVPAWYIAGYLTAFDVTDHPYSLLEGEDYFPDVLVGRLSIQSLTQLQTVISKITGYEGNPPQESDWFRHAIMCSYVVNYGGFYQMYSQRETVMAVREKLLDFTYTVVDTFISPFQSGPANLANMINNGYTFINYRGAGSPGYWAGASNYMFSIWDFPLLNNGFMLPMVTSIVCGGGDFADNNYASSFGETWLTAGTPQSPAGAIAFIGPSEHDTKTPFNNCNDMGIYQGITQEGIFGSAAMMLRGKMELYNNYPDCHEMDGYNDAWDSDMFYFYVYNLLGDPGLEIWTDTPQNIEVDIPLQVSQSASQLQLQVLNTPAEGFTVAVTTTDELISTAFTQADGSAAVNIPIGEDSFFVTLSAYGYLPLTQEIQRSDSIQEVSLQSYHFTSEPETGENSSLVLDICNTTSAQLNSLTVSIISNDEQVMLPVTQQDITDLAVGENAVLEFELEFSEEWRQVPDSELEIRFNDSDLGRYLIAYQINTPRIEYAGQFVQNPENCLLIGESNDMILEMYNAGEQDSGEFMAILASIDNKCQISTGNCNFGNISPQEIEMGSSAMQLTPQASLLAGEPMDFSITVIKSGQPVWETWFTLTAGIINESSPTFSSYGYFALENTDSGDNDVPEYEWIEIAPAAGGNGSEVPAAHETSDGFSTCIPLPFQFCYYGQFYNEITVSTNGWLAMGDEEYVFFRNRIIPSGVGPAAMIAPFWDEMSDGEIYTLFDEDEHCFIIEWYEFLDVNHTENQTFQVILYDEQYYPTNTGEGEIKFQYQEIHNSNQNENFATVGIENHLQTEGLLLSYADRYPATMHTVEAGTAILFTIREGAEVPLLGVNENAIVISLPPDTTVTCQFEIENLSEVSSLGYEIAISHFPQRESNTGRDISGNSINPVNQTYYTGHEMNLYAFMVHENIDNEAVHGVLLDFPDYVQVTSATDIAELHYNGETGYGAQVSWGYGNGNNYNNNTPQTFHVYFIIDEGISSPVPLNWTVTGDGTGAEPHSVSGTITLMPSNDTYIWLEYPNGGEEFAYGITDTIRWTSYGDITEVDVYYTTNFFVNYQQIGAGVPNSGELEWTIPTELTSTGKIRVRDANGNEYDDSDATFVIKGLVITYPHSGVTLQYGNYADILWDFAGAAPAVDIDISVNSGYTWLSLADNVPNTGSYSFQVYFPPSNACKIRISTSDGIIEQVMQGEFSIIDAPVNWMDITETQGILQPLESRTCTLEIDTSGMGHGHYQAYLSITTEYNQIIAIPVFLEILNLDAGDNQITEPAVLSSNYPNPFTSGSARDAGTMIDFSVNQPGHVKLAAYNIKGQIVRVFIDAETDAGSYNFNWNGTDNSGNPLAAGVYFYQLQIDGKILAAKKCLLLK
ncbi:MAG: T9SS type A sorting domain-containing protein [Candidatus Cloacimonetes bacterium]|nr:T9SS type A sorting domain-containing protein [Candidatus Cloacimonadota bacterium]